ncbi:MAG: hypothetical protein IJ725_05075 [Ruminococcus sp.]|nr:hypothetical protein [Ruminococcus sp.]
MSSYVCIGYRVEGRFLRRTANGLSLNNRSTSVKLELKRTVGKAYVITLIVLKGLLSLDNSRGAVGAFFGINEAYGIARRGNCTCIDRAVVRILSGYGFGYPVICSDRDTLDSNGSAVF